MSVFRGIVALLAARQYFALPVVVNVTPQLKAEGGTATLLQHAIPFALVIHLQSRWENGMPVKNKF